MSVFADDWRDCLSSHFEAVVREGDTRTEKTLVSVMYEAGFDEDELRSLKLNATLRVEDLAHDFVPSLDIPSREAVFGEPLPAVNHAPDEADTVVEDANADDEPASSAGGPVQMSMF